MSSKRDPKRDKEEDSDEEESQEEEEISSSSGEEDEEESEEQSESEEEEMSESEESEPDDNKKKPAASSTSSSNDAKSLGQLDKNAKTPSERTLQNQPFDEAMDLSESESFSEGGSGKDSPKKNNKALKNQPFDEALELSGSVQELESPMKRRPGGDESEKPVRNLNVNTSIASKAGAEANGSARTASELKNNPFDEEVDLSDSGESVDTVGQPSPDRKSTKNKQHPQQPLAAMSNAPKPNGAPPKVEEKKTAPAAEERKPTASTTTSASSKSSTAASSKSESKKKKNNSNSEEEEESSSEEESSEEEEEEGEESQSTSTAAPSVLATAAGGYKESDYAHLKVSNDVRELFQYIGRFKAQEIELETRLKCFIPEYIPAVGDMDAFLKILRPDQQQDHLGLKMLDEPSLSQSDATVLDLQLRSTSKKKHGDIVVRSIENAEKSPKEIDRWIKSIADLHRTKPPPQVHYTKTMPDIESLMQVWPEEFEELLGKIPLPGADMDISLEQYIRVICAILDIPVYKNVYESLHVLFTLYLEFRSNQHFMNMDDQLLDHTQAPPPFSSSGHSQSLSFDDELPVSRK